MWKNIKRHACECARQIFVGVVVAVTAGLILGGLSKQNSK